MPCAFHGQLVLRLVAALLLAVLLGSCSSAVVLEVSVEHRLRCVLVKKAGGWQLTAQESTLPLEECREALERVLKEWETKR